MEKQEEEEEKPKEEYAEEKAEEKEDEEEKAEKDKEEDKYPELEKMLKKLVRNAVEFEIQKLGWVKSGVTTKAITGKDETEVVKSKTPVARDALVDELAKLSWRQLTQLETDVKSGSVELPQVE